MRSFPETDIDPKRFIVSTVHALHNPVFSRWQFRKFITLLNFDRIRLLNG